MDKCFSEQQFRKSDVITFVENWSPRNSGTESYGRQASQQADEMLSCKKL